MLLWREDEEALDNIKDWTQLFEDDHDMHQWQWVVAEASVHAPHTVSFKGAMHDDNYFW